MPAPTHRAVSQAAPLGVALLVVLGVVLAGVPELFSSVTIFCELDHAVVQLPKFAILHHALADWGAFPFWQNELYAGAPFHANPESPTTYPPALLLAWLFEPVLALNTFVLVHLALGTVGTFVLVRTLAARHLGAQAAYVGPMVAAVCFASNGYTRIETINLVVYGAAYALLPWILLCIDTLFDSERPRRVAALLALLSMALIGTGGTFVILFGALLCAAWIVWRAIAGGRPALRRAATYVPLVVALALLGSMAKLLPMLDWLETTNRAEPITLQSAVRRALSGPERSFAVYFENVFARTGGIVGFAVLSVTALFAVQSSVGRVVVGATVFVMVLAFGPAYGVLYHVGPPFDLVRTGAERVWVIANQTWPLVVGLGLVAAARYVPQERRESTWQRIAVGAAGVGLLSLVLGHNTSNATEVLGRTGDVDEVVARHELWQDVATRAGNDWRVWWTTSAHPEKRLGDVNEQFLTTALGIETCAGFLGFVWPRVLAEHLFERGDGELLDEAGRARRAATLSARFTIRSANQKPRGEDGFWYYPPGIHGTAIEEDREARPRVCAPRKVVAVLGDDTHRTARALADDARIPRDVAFVDYPDLEAVGPRERELWSACVLAAGTQPVPARELGVPVLRADAANVDSAVVRLERLLGPARAPDAIGRLVRQGPNRTMIELERDASDRIVVISEQWSTNPGWELSIEPAEADAIARTSDGIASAVFVPGGAATIAASYRPPHWYLGLALSALGLLGTAALGLFGRAARS